MTHKFTIPIEQWARGAYPSALYNRQYTGNPDGDCCLGHFDKSLGGTSLSTVANAVSSAQIGARAKGCHSAYLCETEDGPAHALVAINDVATVDDETRMSWLRVGFRVLLDAEVTFTKDGVPLEVE